MARKSNGFGMYHRASPERVVERRLHFLVGCDGDKYENTDKNVSYTANELTKSPRNQQNQF